MATCDYIEGAEVWLTDTKDGYEYKGEVQGVRRVHDGYEYKVKYVPAIIAKNKPAVWVTAQELRPREAEPHAPMNAPVLRKTASHQAHVAGYNNANEEQLIADLAGPANAPVPVPLAETIAPEPIAPEPNVPETVNKTTAATIDVLIEAISKADKAVPIIRNEGAVLAIFDQAPSKNTTVADVISAHNSLVEQVQLKVNLHYTHGKLIEAIDAKISELPSRERIEQIKEQRTTVVYEMKSAIGSYQRLNGRALDEAQPKLVAEISPMLETLKLIDSDLEMEDSLLMRRAKAEEMKHQRVLELDAEMKHKARGFASKIFGYGTQVVGFKDKLLDGLRNLKEEERRIFSNWTDTFMSESDIKSFHAKDMNIIEGRKEILLRNVKTLEKGIKEVTATIGACMPAVLDDHGFLDLLVPLREAFAPDVMASDKAIEESVKSAITGLVSALNDHYMGGEPSYSGVKRAHDRM